MKAKRPLGIGMQELLQLTLKDEMAEADKLLQEKKRQLARLDAAGRKKPKLPPPAPPAEGDAPQMASLIAENDRLKRRIAELEAERDDRRTAAAAGPVSEPMVAEAVECLKTGRPAEALRLLLVFVHRFPAHTRAWNNLGVAYHELGLTAEARSAFRRVLELEPGNATARDNLEAIMAEPESPGEGS